MLLTPERIVTKEVLEWKGLHLLHFSMSSCSQKVRILLREKALDWSSHPVDLARREQKTDWFLGINPNGVVPVLIHDGDVHVESNDILDYVDRTFTSDAGAYRPTGEEETRIAAELMQLEDELHADLRHVTFTFVMPGRLMKDAPNSSEADLETAIGRFERAFGALERRLAETRFLAGDRVTLPDIAWFISADRLVQGGYPIERHPRVAAWVQSLRERPAFAAEIGEGPALPRTVGRAYRWWRRRTGAAIRDRMSAQTDRTR